MFLIYLLQILELAPKKWKLSVFFHIKHMEVMFKFLELQYTEGFFLLNHSHPSFQVTLIVADFYDFPNATFMGRIEAESQGKESQM